MRLKVWKALVNQEPKIHWQAKERFAKDATPELTAAIARLKELGWKTIRFEWKKGKPATFTVERSSGIYGKSDDDFVGVLVEEMKLFWHLKANSFYRDWRTVYYSPQGPEKRRRLYKSRGKAKPFRV